MGGNHDLRYDRLAKSTYISIPGKNHFRSEPRGRLSRGGEYSGQGSQPEEPLER